MRKKLVLVLLAFLSLFAVFIFWMNLTTGQFQWTCWCTVEYLTESEVQHMREKTCPLLGMCKVTNPVKNKLLLLMSNFDLNK
jgi:hypothetical protein